MLQMKLFGGSPPSEVGAFQQISEVQGDLRELQEAITRNDSNNIIYRATAAGTLRLRDLTAFRFSPVDTGTLRAAHTAETNVTADGATGIIFIHPDIVNPVYHKKPSVYGLELIDRGVDWPSQALSAYGDEIVGFIGINALDAAVEVLGW